MNNLINHLLHNLLMAYQIFETETFSKLHEAMETVEQGWVDKIKQQLIENPKTGKPLRFDWFREKKFGDKRMYYLIYTDISKVLLVSFGSKKEQQQIINHIIANKDRYRKIIESV